MEERKRLERELAEAKKRLAMGGETQAAQAARKIGDVNFAGRIVDGVSARDLKGLVDEEKSRLGSGVAAIVARTGDGKAAIVVGVTDDLVGRFNAVDLVQSAAGAVGGKGGGGRPDMAQAGGPDGDKCADTLAAVEAGLAI